MKKGGLKITGTSLGASGFTLGIVSIVFAGIYGIIMSIIGGVFCILQQKNKPTKLGKAGLILNIIGLIFSIFSMVYLAPKMLELLNSFPAA